MEPYWIIKPRSGLSHQYQPLEDHPGLARRFANTETSLSDNTILLELANTFGLLTNTRHERVSVWRNTIAGLRYVLSLKDENALQAACETWSEHVRPQFTLSIPYKHAKRPQFEARPLDLAAALWFQVGGELTHGTEFKRCRQCPEWFPVGKGAKYRKSRQFCSTSCRKANDYAKRKDLRN